MGEKSFRIYLLVGVVAALAFYWHSRQPLNIYIHGLDNSNSNTRIQNNVATVLSEVASGSSNIQEVTKSSSEASQTTQTTQTTQTSEASQSSQCPTLPNHLLPKSFKSREVRNIFRLAKFSCQNKGELVKHKPDGLVVEVGAYDGKEAVEIAPYVRKVITFEPTPSKIPLIQKTINASTVADKIELHHAAVSDKDGTVQLYIPSGDGGSQQDSIGNQKFWSGNDKSVDVPCVRLDSVIHERVVMLKVDTQGHELGVMRGATGLIEKYGIDLVHLEFWPNGYRSNGFDPVELLDFMADYGYVCFDCNEFKPPGAFEKRSFEDFSNGFAHWRYKNGDHGAWTDILCVRP